MQSLKIWLLGWLILLIPLSSMAKERVFIYSLKAHILERPIVKCEALANFLNLKSSVFQFHCYYLSEKEFQNIKEPNFKLAIL